MGRGAERTLFSLETSTALEAFVPVASILGTGMGRRLPRVHNRKISKNIMLLAYVGGIAHGHFNIAITV